MRVRLILFDGFPLLTLNSVLAPIELANRFSDHMLYDWQIRTTSGQPVIDAEGCAVLPSGGLERFPRTGISMALAGDVTPEAAMAEGPQGLPWRVGRQGTVRGEGGDDGPSRGPESPWGSAAPVAHGALQDRIRASQDGNAARLPDDCILLPRSARACCDLILALIANQHGGDLAGAVEERIMEIGVAQVMTRHAALFVAQDVTKNTYVSAALRKMRSAVGEKCDLDDLAADLGISKRHLQRSFRSSLNRSPKRVLNRLRLQMGREMLTSTSHSVGEIARLCGFSSASHFSRSYRQEFGHTPREERTCLSGREAVACL